MAPTQLIFFFNSHGVLSNFWHLDCYFFCNILIKNVKLYFLGASRWSLKTRQKSYPESQPLWRNGHLKNWNFGLFGPCYLKNKKSWHFQFFISQIFRQTFIISENLTCMGQPLLKLWATQLAISFYSTTDFCWEIFKLPVSMFWVIT